MVKMNMKKLPVAFYYFMLSIGTMCLLVEYSMVYFRLITQYSYFGDIAIWLGACIVCTEKWIDATKEFIE